MKKIIGIISLLLCVSLGLANTLNIHTSKQEKVKVYNVNVEQFAKLAEANKGIVLDVRTPEEWAEGTIGTATKINYYDNNFAEQVDKLNKEEAVFVYCKRGGRSSNAAEILIQKGFKKVFNLDGGITAWKEAGKELTKNLNNK